MNCLNKKILKVFLLLIVSFSIVPIYAQQEISELVDIPTGTFIMGDHHNYVDPSHPSDEYPLHEVTVSDFKMGMYTVTNFEYCLFLNESYTAGILEVRNGGVYLTGKDELLIETRDMSIYSRIGWDGKRFSVLDNREKHPVVCLRWEGAVVYCNWLSKNEGFAECYDTTTWKCDFTKKGYRLPTEAEWEYAARGGITDSYAIFPWGNEADASKANWPESDNPFRTGAYPWTTPVGFFDGTTHQKTDFLWPSTVTSYTTGNGVNGFGLYDMSGNVWEFVNDWYGQDYYIYSQSYDPIGPDTGFIMPDGKPYRGMRGGSWYNGENGHGRVANRDPSYYRGPEDPNHPYYHVGFRIVFASSAGESLCDKGLTLTSSEVKNGGELPATYTGDGIAATLPLEWTGKPEGTKSFVLIMHHVDPEGLIKEYWNLYNIPSTVSSLAQNVTGIGQLGINNENRQNAYAPPMSQGPGAKYYVLTLYALSSDLDFSTDKITRQMLLDAMDGLVLAQSSITVEYTRPESKVPSKRGTNKDTVDTTKKKKNKPEVEE
jgi:formylglycine-generating enzyme required for sulfatase activity/phosphatidylethanolamine-binding protein (PEBP) family uncharacterized protein